MTAVVCSINANALLDGVEMQFYNRALGMNTTELQTCLYTPPQGQISPAAIQVDPIDIPQQLFPPPASLREDHTSNHHLYCYYVCT